MAWFVRLLLRVACSAAVALALPAGPAAGGDIVIGKTVTLSSKLLGRDLELSVSVPPGYERESMSYPVLYDLNGFLHAYDSGTVDLLSRFNLVPQMIVVGIPQLDNGYVPTPFESRTAQPAGADLTLQLFRGELIPLVEKSYRTNKLRLLYGHSVGGLLTMYALFNQPDLFTVYLAGSPWFQTRDGYWLKNIEKMARERSFDDRVLFMTVGRQEADLTLETYRGLETWMSGQKLPGLIWKSVRLEGDHGSMVGRNIYDGLLDVFADWQVPPGLLLEGDVPRIEKQVEATSARWARYGMLSEAVLTEQRVNAAGYQLLGRKELDKAVRLLEYNTRRFPRSFNAWDSLAEAHLARGDRETAVRLYKKAVELNPGDTDFAKRVLQSSQAKLRELGVE